MDRRHAIKALSLSQLYMLGIPPVYAGKRSEGRSFALDYIDRVTAMIKRVRDHELDSLLEASYAIARTHRNGANCFCQWETGHSFDGDMFPDRPGDPKLFHLGFSMGKPSVAAKRGDLLMLSVLRQPLDEDIRDKGFFIIGGPTPWCGDTSETELLNETNRQLQIKKYADIWIETYITTRGALMWLPGETTPLGPTSGIMGMVTYWAMIADALRLMAQDGVSLEVKGDEPALKDGSGRVSLSEPLAQHWFAEVLRQIGMIEAEYGTISDIAEAAADCILSGGRLFVYSRYHEALSAEANGKRGGLALINTTWAEDSKFDGNDRDFMIMGIYQPDDEVDLAMLAEYRKRGMKIAAIGPVNSNGRAIKGDNVPDACDYHIGNMCDTYGIFAIPGFSKKVCPTSGLMVNIMFWVTAIRLAELIMEKTGNTPAVLSTGALIGGGDQRRKSTELAKKRGY